MRVFGIAVVVALVWACGSTGTSSTASGAGQGAACTCPNAIDGGDYLCSGSRDTNCIAPLECIDGICTTSCVLDAGTCPAGYTCRYTPHSNETWCAPQ